MKNEWLMNIKQTPSRTLRYYHVQELRPCRPFLLGKAPTREHNKGSRHLKCLDVGCDVHGVRSVYIGGVQVGIPAVQCAQDVQMAVHGCGVHGIPSGVGSGMDINLRRTRGEIS